MDHNDIIQEQFHKQSATFASVAGHYDALDMIVRLSRVTSQDSVLDVACGPGIVACALAKVARQVKGIDLVPAMIEKAKEQQLAQGLKNLSWDIGSANPLPYEHCSYSIVVSRFAFHHFLIPQAVLDEMARVVKWDGRVVLVDVYMENSKQAMAYDTLEKLRDPSHTHALELSDMLSMFEKADLTIIEKYFYQLTVDVEDLLKATQTPDKEAQQFREMIKSDIGVNHLGINAKDINRKISFSFPIVILVGQKLPPINYGLSCRQ